MEVGGASAQIAFRSPRPTGRGVSSVRVNGRDFHVVAISYLGLGANEARDLMQARAGTGKACFPRNASGKDPVKYLADSKTPVVSSLANFREIACGRAYSKVIQDAATTTSRNLRPRNLSGLPGFASAEFIGLGAIPLVYADLKVGVEVDDRRGLKQAMQTTCKGPDAWPQVQALFPSPTPVFAETACSSGSYIWQLLFGTRGIGLDPASFDAQPDLPGRQPSWPSGYAISVLHP